MSTAAVVESEHETISDKEIVPTPVPDISRTTEETANEPAVEGAEDDDEAKPKQEELPDVSHIKPASKHEPVSKAEVEAFANRMDDIASILSDYLNEDPVEAATKRDARIRKMNEVKAEALRQKMIDRYDPKRYVRFESDELINKLLAEADETPAAKQEKEAKSSSLSAEEKNLMTPFEKLSLDEAIRQKEEGNAAFKAGKYEEAHRLYSLALALDVLDKELCLTLHNNRSQVNILRQNYVEALEDATAVLQKHPHNAKALLRRATALSALHRPHEALVDLDAVLRGDPKNVEAKKLGGTVEVEKKEMDLCFFFEKSSPESAATIQRAAITLKAIASEHFAVPVVAEATKEVGDGTMPSPPPTAPEEAAPTPSSEVSVAVPWKQLVETLQTAADHIVDIGCATLFRIHGGLTATERILAVLSTTTTVASAPPAAAVDAALSCSLRVLAGTYRSQVAASLVTAEASQTIIQLAVRLVDEQLAAAKSKSRNDNKAKAASSRLVTAALQLLESLALQSRFASAVAVEITRKDSNNKGQKTLAEKCMSSPSGDSLLYFGTRLFDAVLREQSVADEHFVNTDFQPTVLAGLVTPIMAYQEAAIALLLRLTVAQPQRAAAMLNTPRLVMPMVLILQDILKVSNVSGGKKSNGEEPIASSAMIEGILAVLYNKLLQAPEGRAACVTSLEKDYRLFTFVQEYLLRETPEDPHVLSRMIGLVGKALSANAGVVAINEKAVALEEDKFWRILSQHSTSIATSPSSSSSSSSVVDGSAALKSVQSQCVEHTTLCLAVLYSNKHVAAEKLVTPLSHGGHNKSSPSSTTSTASIRAECLLRLLPQLVSQPIAVGNVALILSCFPVAAHTAVYQKAKAVDAIIAALIAVGTEVFEIERNGGKGNALHVQSKSAQKNLAIALSRCCAAEGLQEEVRSKRGFEVMYAALDRNPDGTVKDNQ